MWEGSPQIQGAIWSLPMADFHVIHQITQGEDVGTLFLAHKIKNFNLTEYIESAMSVDDGRSILIGEYLAA